MPTTPLKLFLTAILLAAALQPGHVRARGFGGFHGGGGGFAAGGFHAGGMGMGGMGAGGFHPGGMGMGGGGFHPEGMGAGGMGGLGMGGMGAGGFRAGGIDAGGFRAGGAGGFGSGFGGLGGGERFSAGGFEAGGMRAGGFGGDRIGAGGFGAGGFGAGAYRADPSRSELGNFLGLPTDGGMHAAGGAVAGRGGVYHGPDGGTIAHGTVAGAGGVAGRDGFAGGAGIAGGTVVKGPEGNVYARGGAAGVGVAAGRGGFAAGGYGFRNYSPTFCRARGLDCRRWMYDRGIFGGDWALTHRWAWFPGRYDAALWAQQAWQVASWEAMQNWFDYQQALEYQYGQNLLYQDGNVYYNSQNVGTTEQYYQQASDLATAGAADPDAKDGDWLTLGVFGLMPPDQKTPQMIFQLSVNKAGVIRGNYFDQVADTTQPVHGSVDKKTQRAAWGVGDNKKVIVETGLYNLTQDESQALVHFSADKTEQYLLIRMKKPADNQP